MSYPSFKPIQRIILHVLPNLVNKSRLCHWSQISVGSLNEAKISRCFDTVPWPCVNMSRGFKHCGRDSQEQGLPTLWLRSLDLGWGSKHCGYVLKTWGRGLKRFYHDFYIGPWLCYDELLYALYNNCWLIQGKEGLISEIDSKYLLYL